MLAVTELRFRLVETRIVGGLYRSDMAVVTWPLIELLATDDRLTFRMRFGLGRFLGPWRLDRDQVKAVATTARGSLLSGIEITGTKGERWVFFAMSQPRERVLRDLVGLGYPAAG
jgi:hypothetical protein